MAKDPLLGNAQGRVTADDGQVFRREGKYWVIGFQGVRCRLRDTRGLHHLAVLLAHPHESIAAPALVQAGEPSDRRTHPQTSSGEPTPLGERARINVTRAIATAL